MIIKDYYDFIVLIAFRTLLVYEGKRKIKVTVLNDYIEEAIKLALKKYEERKEICYVDGWNGKVEFEDYDPIGSLKEFLLNYSDLFMLDGDSVKLTDSISEEEFEGLYSQISINRKDLERLTSQTDKSLLQILGISKFENILKKYRNSEELLEQCYLKINTAEDTSEMREQLEKLLKVRLSFLLNIMMLSVKRKEAICLLSGTFEEVDYDVPPISNLDWENRDNYNEEYGLCDIEDRIYDLFQYAYFGKKNQKVFGFKLEGMLNFIYMEALSESIERKMKEKFDSVFADFEANMIDFEETIRNANENNKRILNSDSDLIDRIFYLTLIKNMDAYVARFGSGEELAEARRRLIYALDTPGDKFYVSGNIEKAYSNIDKGEVEPDDFGFVEEEVVIMTKELFSKPEDQYRVKKILFIATYYELTKNRRVKAEFEANKTHKMYKCYYDLIISPSQDKAAKRTRNK